jgi:hypothetical protein
MATTIAGLRPGEEKLFPGQPRGFPFGDFDVEDVMLPDEGADMGIPSDESDSGEVAPSAETGFGSVIGELRGMGKKERETRRAPSADRAAAGLSLALRRPHLTRARLSSLLLLFINQLSTICPASRPRSTRNCALSCGRCSARSGRLLKVYKKKGR